MRRLVLSGADGTLLPVAEQGRGPAVLLVHGAHRSAPGAVARAIARFVETTVP